MADLDALRPEVRQAVSEADRYVSFSSREPEWYQTWQIIRAELLRLAEIEKERWSVVATRNAAIERTEKAEAEFAALKARIAEAPIVMPLYAGRVHSDVPMTLVVTSPVANEWEGKRVRLVVEE